MLMYLGSEGTYLGPPRTTAAVKPNIDNTATGILTIVSDVNRFLTAYISLSATLNVLLTLMIVVRLVMRGRSIRVTTGSSAGIGGLYKTIATMLVESSALFTVSSVLLIGTWAAGNPISTLFTFILAENQVRNFPQPRSMDGFPHVTTERTGRCFITHHSTGRQQECGDERH